MMERAEVLDVHNR